MNILPALADYLGGYFPHLKWRQAGLDAIVTTAVSNSPRLPVDIRIVQLDNTISIAANFMTNSRSASADGRINATYDLCDRFVLNKIANCIENYLCFLTPDYPGIHSHRIVFSTSEDEKS